MRRLRRPCSLRLFVTEYERWSRSKRAGKPFDGLTEFAPERMIAFDNVYGFSGLWDEFSFTHCRIKV